MRVVPTPDRDASPNLLGVASRRRHFQDLENLRLTVTRHFQELFRFLNHVLTRVRPEERKSRRAHKNGVRERTVGNGHVALLQPDLRSTRSTLAQRASG